MTFPIGRNTWARPDTSSDEVILVDEHDVAIGTASKLRAHEMGLRHRAISVVICDGRKRLLLQKRAAAKYHSGGLWSNTCCTHPRSGEEPADTATRRLGEEMGIVCPSTFLFKMQYRARVSDLLIEDEIVHVFGGVFDGSPCPDAHEVSEWSWSMPDVVAMDVAKRPQRYTIWFQMLCSKYWTQIEQWLETLP